MRVDQFSILWLPPPPSRTDPDDGDDDDDVVVVDVTSLSALNVVVIQNKYIQVVAAKNRHVSRC